MTTNSRSTRDATSKVQSTSQQGWAREALRTVRQEMYLPIGLVVLIIVGSVLSPYFLSGSNLQNIAVTGAIVCVLAVGQFMVIVTGGIDLSVGSLAALSTVVAAVVMRSHTSSVVAVLATLGVTTAAGLISGCVVVFGRITPFITTLAMMSMLQGVAYAWQGGTYIAINNSGFNGFFYNSSLAGVPAPVAIFLVVTLVFAAIMRWTAFGRQLYAIGGNSEAARLSGLPVKRNLVSAYTISGFLAGLAGLMLAAQLGQGNSNVASGYELDAIAAAVVGGASLFGGVGSPVAAVLGALLIGTISDIMDLREIQAQSQLIIKGLVILLAVYMTSGGGIAIRRRLSHPRASRINRRRSETDGDLDCEETRPRRVSA